MKKKPTTKKAAAKPETINVNLDYVMEIADEAIATIMALRGLVQMLVDEREARK